MQIRDCAEFEYPAGSQISIFNFWAKKFHAEGLKYPIYDFTNWWQGTLNETVLHKVRIEAEGYFLIFVNYPESDPAEKFRGRRGFDF